jgi:hypothetical protein
MAENGRQAPAPLRMGKNPNPVLVKYEAELVPKSIRTLWWREKSLLPAGIRTPNRPFRRLVAISASVTTHKRKFDCQARPRHNPDVWRQPRLLTATASASTLNMNTLLQGTRNLDERPKKGVLKRTKLNVFKDESNFLRSSPPSLPGYPTSVHPTKNRIIKGHIKAPPYRRSAPASRTCSVKHPKAKNKYD